MNIGLWVFALSALSVEVFGEAAPEASGVDVCQLARDVGPCRAEKRRFFYNSMTGECDIFFWGGCEGNGNNFETLEACENRCVGPPPVDTCYEPPVYPGEDLAGCLASISMWTYHPAKRRCVPFNYGGCGGSGNLFNTEKECQRRCDPESLTVCEQPPVHPTSPSCLAAFPSYTFDPDKQECVFYEYGGCGATENLFDTEKECQKRCDPGSLTLCEQPPVDPSSPTCLAAVPSYTFDPEKQECVFYEYGGCGATGNLFDTIEDCQAKCDVFALNVCDQPKVTGPCLGSLRRYWFNKRTGTCEQFVYGGCGGNGNNFANEEECGQKCFRV